MGGHPMQFPVLRKTVLDQQVSPGLEPVVMSVQAELERAPIDLSALGSALERLLVFLSSPAGRTHANCAATDSFFMGVNGECEYSYLPGPLAKILDDMAGTLHDAVSSPEVARSFESTPEQLLVRLQAIQLEA